MSGFHVREAKQEDVLGMARVRVDAWRATYKGIIPDDFLANLSAQAISERWKRVFWEEEKPGLGVFVAENDQGEISGIAVCGPEQGQDSEYLGEIYILYVLPACQRRGIGKQLVAASLRHLIERLHCNTMLVWVLAENPYRRFYESLGGKPVKTKTKEIGGKPLTEVGYGWEDIQQLRIHITGS